MSGNAKNDERGSHEKSSSSFNDNPTTFKLTTQSCQLQLPPSWPSSLSTDMSTDSGRHAKKVPSGLCSRESIIIQYQYSVCSRRDVSCRVTNRILKTSDSCAMSRKQSRKQSLVTRKQSLPRPRPPLDFSFNRVVSRVPAYCIQCIQNQVKKTSRGAGDQEERLISVVHVIVGCRSSGPASPDATPFRTLTAASVQPYTPHEQHHGLRMDGARGVGPVHTARTASRASHGWRLCSPSLWKQWGMETLVADATPAHFHWGPLLR